MQFIHVDRFMMRLVFGLEGDTFDLMSDDAGCMLNYVSIFLKMLCHTIIHVNKQ